MSERGRRQGIRASCSITDSKQTLYTLYTIYKIYGMFKLHLQDVKCILINGDCSSKPRMFI
jgi:hypothetical protein